MIDEFPGGECKMKNFRALLARPMNRVDDPRERKEKRNKKKRKRRDR